MMMIKKSEQPNKCRYSLMYRGFSVRKKANNAAQSLYKIRTEKVNVIKVFKYLFGCSENFDKGRTNIYGKQIFSAAVLC